MGLEASLMLIPTHGPTKRSHEKIPTLLSIKNPGWLIGVLTMVYYNPHSSRCETPNVSETRTPGPTGEGG